MAVERYPDFTYENLNRGIKKFGQFVETEEAIASLSPEKEFIMVSTRLPKNVFYTDTIEGQAFDTSRLKFHISVPENMYERSWNLLKTLFVDYKLYMFKICREAFRMSQKPSQRGKDITIYCRKRNHFNKDYYERLLIEITRILVEAGIPPGYRTLTEGDRADIYIQGSNYISYRCEAANSLKKPGLEESERRKLQEAIELTKELCGAIQINGFDQQPPMVWNEAIVASSKQSAAAKDRSVEINVVQPTTNIQQEAEGTNSAESAVIISSEVEGVSGGIEKEEEKDKSKAGRKCGCRLS